MIFTQDSWGDLGRGAAATADGIIPFADPFEKYYADECGGVDSSYEISRFLGGASRDILLWATGAGVGAVARAEGISLTAGQTVMLGEFGPSLSGLIVGGEGAVSAGSLAAGYAVKTAGRVDSFLNLRDAIRSGK